MGVLLLMLPPAGAQSVVGANAQDDPGTRVLAAAEQSVGKRMWLGYGLPSGKLGCAAALCNVLKQAGFPYAKSAVVVTLRNQLLSGPAQIKEISIKSSSKYGVDQAKLAQTAKPGDLIMGYMNPPDKRNLGSDAHCGVVAGNGEVYANDWLDGIWKRDVVDRFFAWYRHVYVMKILSPVRSQQRSLLNSARLESGKRAISNVVCPFTMCAICSGHFKVASDTVVELDIHFLFIGGGYSVSRSPGHQRLAKRPLLSVTPNSRFMGHPRHIALEFKQFTSECDGHVPRNG